MTDDQKLEIVRHGGDARESALVHLVSSVEHLTKSVTIVSQNVQIVSRHMKALKWALGILAVAFAAALLAASALLFIELPSAQRSLIESQEQNAKAITDAIKNLQGARAIDNSIPGKGKSNAGEPVPEPTKTTPDDRSALPEAPDIVLAIKTPGESSPLDSTGSDQRPLTGQEVKIFRPRIEENQPARDRTVQSVELLQIFGPLEKFLPKLTADGRKGARIGFYEPIFKPDGTIVLIPKKNINVPREDDQKEEEKESR